MVAANKKTTPKKELAFAPGFLTEPLIPRDEVRLLGTRCQDCGAVLLGSRKSCEACASLKVEVIPLSRTGQIWSHTVMRYVPPWPFSTPNPYEPPVPVAWVKLSEGVQLISLIKCDPEELQIGLSVEMIVEKGWEDDEGNDVLMYKFQPVKKGANKRG